MILLINNALVSLEDIAPEDITLEGTARALGRVNRFCGNFDSISVAQHAVIVESLVSKLGGTPRQRMAGLHHDDAEAIIGDIPGPVKSECPGFRRIEAIVQMAIMAKYEVYLDDPLVAKADDICGRSELWHNATKYNMELALEAAGVEMEKRCFISRGILEPWTANKAASRYMDKHHELQMLIDKDDEPLPEARNERDEKDVGLS
jgi:hypothetical protein